jgi:acetyltransferase-like isoleucine patch superfamily enzyme
MALDPSVRVHPLALCESESIGSRTRVWAFAQIMRGAIVGSDCNVGGHAFIETGADIGNHVTVKNGVLIWDGVSIEDYVFLGPSVIFTNVLVPRAAFKKGPEQFAKTRVRRGASIGANATVLCGITIGECAMVGAGTTVLRDVPAHALVVGSPARRIGWACACGIRLPDSLECECSRKYSLVSEREGLASREPVSA